MEPQTAHYIRALLHRMSVLYTRLTWYEDTHGSVFEFIISPEDFPIGTNHMRFEFKMLDIESFNTKEYTMDEGSTVAFDVCRNNSWMIKKIRLAIAEIERVTSKLQQLGVRSIKKEDK